MNINKGILFLLGSGASVDSGLKTYRGLNSINGSIVDVDDSYEVQWAKHDWLIQTLYDIKDNGISDTYATLQAIVDKVGKDKVTVMTQNIDGLIKQVTGAKIIELHGTVRESICDYCGNIEDIKYRCDDKKCSKCGKMLRSNIIRLGENLKVDYRSISKRAKYDLVVIVGTTMQFDYLRWIVGRAKMGGSKVIHINPDPAYNDPVIGVKFHGYDFVNYVKKPTVREKEQWIQSYSSDGLKEVLDMINEQN